MIKRGQIRLTESDATRFPSAPVNLSIASISRRNFSANSLSGKAIFSDYTLWISGLNAALLGGRLDNGRVAIDPFRSAEGKIRAGVDQVRISNIQMSDAYYAFVDTSAAGRTMKGTLNALFQTAWSDTECLAFNLFVDGADRGVISEPVIRSLVLLAPKESRPPGFALSIVGDYKYDTFGLTVDRSPEIHDLKVNLCLESRHEMCLQEFRLEGPLLHMLNGLRIGVRNFSRFGKPLRENP